MKKTVGGPFLFCMKSKEDDRDRGLKDRLANALLTP